MSCSTIKPVLRHTGIFQRMERRENGEEVTINTTYDASAPSPERPKKNVSDSPDDVKDTNMIAIGEVEKRSHRLLATGSKMNQNDLNGEKVTLSEPIGIKQPLHETVCLDMAEFYDCMLSKEKYFRVKFRDDLHNEYLRYRPDIVKLMGDACDDLHLLTATAHCAIFYFDRIIVSCERISRTHWPLTMSACISIAMKYNETEDGYSPTVWQIQKALKVPKIWSNKYFRERGEINVLKILEWNLSALPPVYFVEFYIANGVLFVDDKGYLLKYSNTREIMSIFEQYANFFCVLCMAQHDLRSIPSSIISSAIIHLIRQVLGIQPWRRELKLLTGFVSNDLKIVIDTIKRIYHREYPDHFFSTLGYMEYSIDSLCQTMVLSTKIQ